MVSVAGTEVERENAADWPAPPGRAALAWRDLADGFTRVWMWSALAVQDIKLRYRGSMLGPFWLTISTLVMVVAMGVIYAQLFHQEPSTYLPFLTVRLIVWQLLNGMIIPGWVLIGINGVWISILLGMVSPRFRDVPPIVASFLQVLFFLTPLIWPPELLGQWHPIATFTPLFAAVDVVRAPLIGVPTAP